MKHVNLEPNLERKKDEIMEEFRVLQSGTKQESTTTTVTKSAPDDVQVQTPEQLKLLVIDALKTVYDPEIPLNIYDLGLIYAVVINANHVDIDMTLTAPGCPVAYAFPGMVESAVIQVPGIDSVHVELVWDPPWTQDKLSEAARLQLGLI